MPAVEEATPTVSRRFSDEPDLRSKVVIYHATKLGKKGFRVGILGGDSMFCESLEESLRRVIYLLGLEPRDILVFDTVPGILMDDGPEGCAA